MASLLNNGDEPTPLRDCLLLLPFLPVKPDGTMDYAAADPDLLVRITACATSSSQIIQRGTASIGRMMVYIAPEIGLGEVPADAIESLGWLLSELADAALTLQVLATSCRRHIADYQPNTNRRHPNGRF